MIGTEVKWMAWRDGVTQPYGGMNGKGEVGQLTIKWFIRERNKHLHKSNLNLAQLWWPCSSMLLGLG